MKYHYRKMGQLNDPYSNVKQATKAAVELGLMPSIDPIDFHKRRLDKLSILTFVDQLYQNFKNAQRMFIFYTLLTSLFLVRSRIVFLIRQRNSTHQLQ